MLRYKADRELDVDFCSIFYKFTLESFVKMTCVLSSQLPSFYSIHSLNPFSTLMPAISFGKDLNMLEAEMCSDTDSLSKATTEFAIAFDYVQNQQDWRFAVMIGWSIFENVFSSMGYQMRTACKTLDNFVYALIDERQMLDKSENSESGKDLLELFMKVEDDAGKSLQRFELRDAVMNLIVAGR